MPAVGRDLLEAGRDGLAPALVKRLSTRMIRIGLALAALLASATAAPAAYCAMYINGSRSCGIPSLEMCWQSVSGVGGSCQEDFTDRIPPNYLQRTRSPAPPPPQRSRGTGSFGPMRPITTSPCMSLSGDTCSNYLH